MSVKFILGRGGSGKSTYMLDKIQERVQDNETSPVILLLPEQYTFEMEKRISKLFSGDKKDKYLRARVLSFKTMGNIVFSNVGGLTDVNINSSGKAMITYRAIESASNDLEIFSKSASQSGFVNSISEMISELKQFNISYEKLEVIAEEIENETLKLKLKDLSKIYKQFEEKLHENYIDSQDMLNSLAEKIEACDYFKDAYIYIDEFTGFTPNQYKVLRTIFNKAKEVNISLTVDNPHLLTYSKSDAFSRTKDTYAKIVKLCNEEGIKLLPSVDLNKDVLPRFKNSKELQHLEKYYNSYPYKIYEEKTNNIFIKEFNNLYSEVEQVAKEIVNLVRDKGVRYRDITVATRDLNKYDFLVRSIFNEYKIPNFIDKKREAKALLEVEKYNTKEKIINYLNENGFDVDNKKTAYIVKIIEKVIFNYRMFGKEFSDNILKNNPLYVFNVFENNSSQDIKKDVYALLKNNNVTIDLVDFVDNVADNINLLINEEIKLNEQNKKLAYNA